MLLWTSPSENDISSIYNVVSQLNYKGNDCSYTNIILYKEKFNTKISIQEEVLFRKIIHNNQEKYLFPLCSQDKLKNSITKLLEETKNINFTQISTKQKLLLEELFPQKFIFSTDRSESDYLYFAEDLANLPGKKYHKKKNHISKFNKTFSDIKIENINDSNSKDFIFIADKWQKESSNSLDDSIIYENKIIKMLINNYKLFNTIGTIIYVNENPIAMSLATKINQTTADIHFEKALSEYASFGAYSIINNQMAKVLLNNNIKYINREEDLGIEGLRKAKLSYYPAKLIDKYNAILK